MYHIEIKFLYLIPLLMMLSLGCTPERITGELGSISSIPKVSSEKPVISASCGKYLGGRGFDCTASATHPNIDLFNWSVTSNSCSYLAFDTSTGKVSGSPPYGLVEGACAIEVKLSYQEISRSFTFTLEQEECPVGYVMVPGNDLFGTKDFCMMKFEAKDDGVGSPVSQAANTPMVVANEVAAFDACDSLNSPSMSGTYSLTSNDEWMSAAVAIEAEASNWSGVGGVGGVGDGSIPRGHSDNSPASALDITDENDPYIGTGNSAGSGWDQKRTHNLTNGNIIWDMGGNAWETVDWNKNDIGFTYGVTDEPGSWVNLNTAPTGSSLLAIHYQSLLGYENLQGLGQKFGDVGGGGVTARGGGYYLGTKVGVFTIGFRGSPGDAASFRCVYRFE